MGRVLSIGFILMSEVVEEELTAKEVLRIDRRKLGRYAAWLSVCNTSGQAVCQKRE